MDYKQTLSITLNDKDPRAMAQRANLPAREPEIQRYWEEIDLYGASLRKPAPKGDFILHDGPPYSNGNIHIGHALNKIAKDIIVKYKTMAGYRAPYVPGWDNHGMPIENEVAREFRAKGERPDRLTMRRRCREYAAGFVDTQREQFKRLGVRGDWEHPYTTMSHEFEARIVKVFADLAEKGYVYRGLKAVLWCASCETALADAEVEYEPHTSASITVRFPIAADPNRVFGAEPENPAGAYALIWTTTPWTIPANMALAVHPEAEYVVAPVGDARYLIAAPLLAATLQAIGAPPADPGSLPRFRGADLAGIVARHPLFDRPSPIVFADYVTMDDGTGIVHTAPGHGKEDFETGQREGLEILCPVDQSGTLTNQAGARFSGARILGGEADRRVIEALEESGHLLARTTIEHSYPHCWRCHNPLLFRATVQWFMNIDHDGHREKSIDAINQVRWYPPVSRNRITSMVGGRPDWCLSRQRAWGVGIPAFYCRSCGREILDPAALKAVHDLVSREGADAWYERPAAEVLPPGYTCPHCGAAGFDKETDILDVWFDSGSTHLAVLDDGRWPELRWPADLYLEGSDQHRGWFNSSLMISVALRGRAPYEAVITNGWVLDENGKAMHKSLGNVVSPLDVMKEHGADILRLWVASTDYFEDVRCSEGALRQVSETYRRIRNTFRFMVNNLHGFDAATDAVADEALNDLDRWILARLDSVVQSCAAGYEAYEFHRIYHAVNAFCANDLSAFYLDVIKDRLYCSGPASPGRRSAQTALFRLASTMAQLLAPILSHTAEEVWERLGLRATSPSVQLTDFPAANRGAWADVEARWEPVLSLRDAVNLAVEVARQEKRFSNPLEAAVQIRAPQALIDALQPVRDDLPAILKVSQVSLEAADVPEPVITAVRAPGQKCVRCWLVKPEVGTHPDHPELCPRCTEVVLSLEGNPQ